MNRTVEQARDCGYAETIFGRRRYLPELSSSNHNMRAFGERVARNMPIQGAAADIIKLAMLRVRGPAEGRRAPGTAGPPGPRRADRGMPGGGTGAGVRPGGGGDGAGVSLSVPLPGGDFGGQELGGCPLRGKQKNKGSRTGPFKSVRAPCFEKLSPSHAQRRGWHRQRRQCRSCTPCRRL